MNPSLLDEEEALPSPPLDNLAFLNPHLMSLELFKKFLDVMDDYGNPRKSSTLNKNRIDGGKPLVGKWKQKPTSLDGETVQDKLEATKRKITKRKLQGRYQQALKEGKPQ
ncbi:hypothetical protein Tco_0721110 [Tanacetum coccineum]